MKCDQCGRKLDSLIEKRLGNSRKLLVRKGDGSVEKLRARYKYECPVCRTTILYGRERAKELLGKPQLEQKMDEVTD